MKTSEQDDLDWFEVLAGRIPPDVDPSTRLEAEALREALLEDHTADIPQLPARPGEFERLVERAKRELSHLPVKPVNNESGSKAPAFQAWWSRFTSQWPRWAPIGAIATVLLSVGIGIYISKQSDNSQPILLGGGHLVLKADNPLAKAAEIQTDCLSAGLHCKTSKLDDHGGMRVKIKPPESPDQRAVRFFHRYEITPPSDNAPIILEIRPTE
jgi:hypothetical protein